MWNNDLKTSCLHGSCFNGQGAQASTDLHQTLGCTAQAVDAAKVPGETLTRKREKTAGSSTCQKLEKFSDYCANWLMWSELNRIELVWCIGVDNSTGSSSRTDAKAGLCRKHLFLPICGTITASRLLLSPGDWPVKSNTHIAFTIVRHTFGGNNKDPQSILKPLKQVEGSAILHQNCIIIGKMRAFK